MNQFSQGKKIQKKKQAHYSDSFIFFFKKLRSYFQTKSNTYININIYLYY